MTPAIRESLSYPPEKQRYLYYTGKLEKNPTWESVNYFENDDMLIYNENTFSLKMCNHLFPQRKSRKGFTYDKKTKKLKIWYLSNPKDLKYLSNLLTALKMEWVVNEGFFGGTKSFEKRNRGTGEKTMINLAGWLTKGLLEKIISGKITNPTEACQYIIKSNRWKGLDTGLLKKYIKRGALKHMVLSNYNIIDNPNDILEKEFEGRISSNYDFIDMINQAKALSKKINTKWSQKRIADVHRDWTRELMKFELEMMEDHVIDYHTQPILPKGFELLHTKRRLFEEGTIMDHCIYTNYYDRVKERRYIALHVTDENGEEATVGIRLSQGYRRDEDMQPHVDQIKSKRNGPPSKSITQMVNRLMTPPGAVGLLENDDPLNPKALVQVVEGVRENNFYEWCQGVYRESLISEPKSASTELFMPEFGVQILQPNRYANYAPF